MTDRQLRSGTDGEEGASAAENGERPRRRRPALALGVLHSHLGYLVRRLQLWIFQDFTRTLRKFDIRPAQYSVLVVIKANAGLSQADVAEALGIERARLVRLLDELEQRGLIRRLPSPRDRRSHALVLTRDGAKKLKPILALAREHEARLEAALGPGTRNVLLAALRQFSAAQGGASATSETETPGEVPQPLPTTAPQQSSISRDRAGR